MWAFKANLECVPQRRTLNADLKWKPRVSFLEIGRASKWGKRKARKFEHRSCWLIKGEIQASARFNWNFISFSRQFSGLLGQTKQFAVCCVNEWELVSVGLLIFPARSIGAWQCHWPHNLLVTHCSLQNVNLVEIVLRSQGVISHGSMFASSLSKHAKVWGESQRKLEEKLKKVRKKREDESEKTSKLTKRKSKKF